jgi:hypothetical protein
MNIRETPTSMTVHCNAGSRVTKLVGDLPGYGTVWYDPKAIAKILSLNNVKSKYQVLYNSIGNGSFCVKKPDGTMFEFKESDSELYYLDTKKHENAQNQGVLMVTANTQNQGMLLVNTVQNNKENYTNNDYLRAFKARELQIKIGCPRYKDFARIVTARLIPICTITMADVVAAQDIFGPNIGSLKARLLDKNQM